MSPLSNDDVDLLEHDAPRARLDDARDVCGRGRAAATPTTFSPCAGRAVDREPAAHVERRVGLVRRHLRLLGEERKHLGNLRAAS